MVPHLSTPAVPLPPAEELEHIVESALGQLKAGKPLDVEALASAHPQHAADLRELLPMMGSLLRLNSESDHFSDSTLLPLERDSTHAPKQLGDFQLIREIGRGGMGVVFEAEQLSMGRRVALKVLPFAALVDGKALLRFRNEVRAAAALDHPHIVSVYSIGEDRGVHYYAMQLIRGQTLAETIRNQKQQRSLNGSTQTKWNDKSPAEASPSSTNDLTEISSFHSVEPPPPLFDTQTGSSTTLRSRASGDRYQNVARLGIQAAEALQHAHDLAVLHRDIKPSNLLLDAAGNLYVTDFGLARIEADAGLTVSGDVLGTLRYMAPEQALAKRVAIDQRADVYALGATLYEMLALQPAFAENDRRLLLKQIEFEEPIPLTKLDRRIPLDLQTIVAKAMSKLPEERYQTAQQLADDLRAFLEDLPIRAKPPTYANRLARWARRHHHAVLMGALSCLLLTAILAISVVLINRSRVQALAALDSTNELLYTSDIIEACQAWEKGWADSVQIILARHRPADAEPERRRFDWHLLNSLSRPPKSTTLIGHVGPVTELAIFPDLKRLASVGEDGTLRIWNISTGQLLKSIELGGEALHSVAVSPDGRYIAAGSQAIYLCDTHQNHQVRELSRGDASVESLAFTPDGTQLAAGFRYDHVELLALDGTLIQRVPCASRVESMQFSSENSRLYFPNRRSDRSSVGLIESWKSDLSKVLQAYSHPMRSNENFTVARLSPDERYLLVGEHYLSRASILDIQSKGILAETLAARDSLLDLDYAPNGTSIALSYANGTIEWYPLHLDGNRTPSIEQRPLVIEAHRGKVYCTRFIGDAMLATAGADGLIRIWYLAVSDGTFQRKEIIDNISFSPDGGLILCQAAYHHYLVDTRTMQEVYSAAIPGVVGQGTAWANSGNRLAFCARDQPVVEVATTTDRSLFEIAHGTPPHAATFSPHDEQIAVVGDTFLQVCDGSTGSELWKYPLPGPGLVAVYSHSGDRLVTAGRFDTIQIFDPVEQLLLKELKCDSETHSITFSSDDSLLVTGHADAVIRVWRLPEGELQTQFVGHSRSVRDICFSPDGDSLISAADDGTVRLWSIKHARSCGVIHRAVEEVCRLSLSPDGRQLAIRRKGEHFRSEVLLWRIDGLH